MRHAISITLLLCLVLFFQAGCGGVGVRINPQGVSQHYAYHSYSWPDSQMQFEELSVDFTPLIIGAVVAVTAAVLYVHYSAKRDKVRYGLTPEGERVRLIMHAEAPADALFLGDVQTAFHFHLTLLKNDLRNQTARLGGDLVVLDDIQQDIRQGQTWGYIGIGRAYKTKDRPYQSKDRKEEGRTPEVKLKELTSSSMIGGYEGLPLAFFIFPLEVLE